MSSTLKQNVVATLLAAGLAILFSLAAPDATAVPKPAAKGGSPAIDAAVEALRKEYAAHLKDPKLAIRQESDYFAKDRPADVTADAILTAMEQPMAGDPRLVAYVRWQLLSALPETVEGPAQVARAIKIYRAAPPPVPRYGLRPAEQQKLDAALVGARRQDDVALTLKLEALATPTIDANRPLLAYRDAWYRRLPRSPATFRAALEDAQERQDAAAGAEVWVPTVIADVQGWLVAGDVDARECAALAEFVGQLRSRPPPSYYASAAVRREKLVWVKKTDSIDPRKKLTNLHQELVARAQKPAPANPPK